MARYTIRIELLEIREAETPDPYTTVHEAVEQAGYERTIQSRDGTVFHLPPAEYTKTSARSISAIRRNIALRISEAYDRPFRVLVTEVKGQRHWHNLLPVQSKKKS